MAHGYARSSSASTAAPARTGTDRTAQRRSDTGGAGVGAPIPSRSTPDGR